MILSRAIHRLSLCTLGILTCAALPLAAHADDTTPNQDKLVNACLDQATDAIGSEDRLFRAVVVGEHAAAELGVGSERYDKSGLAWSKTGTNEWKTLSKDQTMSNAQMDSNAEFPARRGWLEVKQASTSELIPPLLQSMRAFQCHVQMICARASLSVPQKAGATIPIVNIAGCDPAISVPVFSACAAGPDPISINNKGTIDSQCAQMGSAMVLRESQLLKLVVAYDAAQRSLLQFTGIVDTFLKEFRFPLLEPIWQAVQAFQQFGHIPCFDSQCDQ